MESVLGIDHSKVELLDRVVLELEASFVDAPASVVELAKNAASGVRLLQNSLKLKLSEHVAQLARDGDPDAAAEALATFFPALQNGNVREILRLLYVEQKDLASAIRFVEKIRVEFQQGAYEALYDDICHKGHTRMPEMLLLQRSMVLADESDTLERVDEDCLGIVDQIVQGVKIEDYELSFEVVNTLGSSILDEKMACIVEKVHSAGTLEETLLLIKYSQGLLHISIQCVLIHALFKVLQSKNLLESLHGMHLWALVISVKEKANLVEEKSNQEKYLSTFNELDKNKHEYLKMYQNFIEDPSGEKMKALHDDNWGLHSIIPDFVEYYYEGDLLRAQTLLLAARKSKNYRSAGSILSFLYKEMILLKQEYSLEAFELFSLVKLYMTFDNYDSLSKLLKMKFEELRSMVPPCLQLLLWPEPAAGAKLRLVNKFFNSPLFSSDSKVYCWLPGNQKDDQLWSARVDLNTCLVTFTHPRGNLNSQVAGKTLSLAEEKSCIWRVKPIDQLHVKIFLQDGNLISSIFRKFIWCLRQLTISAR
jgi:hypothetical protein